MCWFKKDRQCLSNSKCKEKKGENNKWLIKYINNNGIIVRNYITNEEQVSEYLGGLK